MKESLSTSLAFIGGAVAHQLFIQPFAFRTSKVSHFPSEPESVVWVSFGILFHTSSLTTRYAGNKRGRSARNFCTLKLGRPDLRKGIFLAIHHGRLKSRETSASGIGDWLAP